MNLTSLQTNSASTYTLTGFATVTLIKSKNNVVKTCDGGVDSSSGKLKTCKAINLTDGQTQQSVAQIVLHQINISR